MAGNSRTPSVTAPTAPLTLGQATSQNTLPMPVGPSYAPSGTPPASDWFAQNMPSASATGDALTGTLTQQFGQGAPGGGYGGQFVAPTGVNFMNDPAYQFNASELTRGVTNSAFAKGQGLTGGALRDLQKYQSGLAANTYQQVFNNALAGQTFNRDTAFGNQDRALNSYLASRDTFWGDTDRLFGRNFSLASLGENAAAGYGNNLGAYGVNGGNLITGSGNAGASGTIGVGNAVAGGIGQGTNMAALLAQLHHGGGG